MAVGTAALRAAVLDGAPAEDDLSAFRRADDLVSRIALDDRQQGRVTDAATRGQALLDSWRRRFIGHETDPGSRLRHFQARKDS